MRRFLCLAAMCCAAVCGTASAIPITVDFEADAAGTRANGFSAAGVDVLSFSDTVGSDLGIFQVPEGTGLRSLVVGVDQDGSALEMMFATDIDTLSLAFGNDGPSNTNAGDLAVLTLFLGAAQIGEVAIELNRDDIMNQSISFGSIGGPLQFNRALFGFTNSSLSLFTGGGSTNVGATEVVDNIAFNTIDRIEVRVPEPATDLLLSTTLAAILLLHWRRKRRQPGPA